MLSKKQPTEKNAFTRSCLQKCSCFHRDAGNTKTLQSVLHFLFSYVFHRPKLSILTSLDSANHLSDLFPPLIISRSPKYIPILLFLARTALILGNVLRLDAESALCCLPPRTRCLVSWTTTRPEQRQRRSLQSFSFQPDTT